MSKWMSKLIFSRTVNCWNCNKIVDKKVAFSIQLNTADGLLDIKTCEECGNEVNELLKAIEEVKNDSAL